MVIDWISSLPSLEAGGGTEVRTCTHSWFPGNPHPIPPFFPPGASKVTTLTKTQLWGKGLLRITRHPFHLSGSEVTSGAADKRVKVMTKTPLPLSSGRRRGPGGREPGTGTAGEPTVDPNNATASLKDRVPNATHTLRPWFSQLL